MTKRKYRSITKSAAKTKYIFALLVIFMIVLGNAFLIFGLNYHKNVLPIYNFTAQKDSDYEVLLNQNNFYVTNTLPSGGYYASKSINNYVINFKYDFNAEKLSNLEYNYSITADLIGIVKNIDEQDKEVWSRTFTLLDNKKEKKENISTFNINEKINIDYQYYNNLARSYEKTYGIAIDATLKVHFNISYQIDLSNFMLDTQNIDDFIELDIPITNTVTNIKENYENTTSKSIIPDSDSFKNIKILYYIISAVLIIGAILIIIIRLRRNYNAKTDEDLYRHNINRILKYYRDLIVTVTNRPNLENLEIMYIDILDDLIDVAEQNQKSIIHYKEPKDIRSNLYVFVNGYAYIYVVTCNKLR